MSKHKPIRFENSNIDENVKSYLKEAIERSPVAKNTLQVVLVMVVIGGLLTTASVTPGLLEMFNRFLAKKKAAKKERYERLWRSFYHLKKSKDIEFVEETSEGELVYKITKSGKIKIRKFLVEMLEIKKPKKWDGKWRLFLFDIPEKYKHIRKLFQGKISEMGLYQMQKSVWVHPFPCEEEIIFLINFLNIKSFVEIITISDMPNGKVLYHFKDKLKEVI